MFNFDAENLLCVIYLRVSTDKQAEEGYGLDVQMKGCMDAINYKRWRYLETYKDDGYSGTLTAEDRPELKRLMKDARKGKFKMVVVYNIDRIGRTLGIITGVVDELERFGIGIAARTNNIDTSTSMGKFTMQIVAGVAELDRKSMIEKMSKGRAERKKQKGYCGGKPPFGYDLENGLGRKNKKQIIIHEKESEIIREIFKMESLGGAKIAEHLNNDGNKKPRLSEIWSRQTINKILKRRDIYEGGIINDNINGIRWPRILE